MAATPADALRTALARAVDPRDLFSRWSRVERFVHSRHRVLVRAAGDRYVLAEHAGPPATPPTEPESALILGVLAALLESIGAVGLRITLGHVAEGPCVLDSGRYRSPPAGAALSLWRFAWRSFEPREPPADRGEAKGDPEELARRLVGADPARGWTLETLALELALSRRTLQRRLKGAGGFSALVAEVRAAEAARMLVGARRSLAEIGFGCGYADQPHFTREFARRTAMTPGRYRTEFAAGTVR